RAPTGIGIDRGVTRNVDDDRAAPFLRGGGKGSEESFGQSERAQQVHHQRLLQILTFRVGERHERGRSEARCTVDEHIEPTKIASDLQCDRVDLPLTPDVADNSIRPRLIGDPLDRTGSTSDKRNMSAADHKQADESQSEAGRSTRDGYAQSSQVLINWHRSVLIFQWA